MTAYIGGFCGQLSFGGQILADKLDERVKTMAEENVSEADLSGRLRQSLKKLG